MGTGAKRKAEGLLQESKVITYGTAQQKGTELSLQDGGKPYLICMH